MKLTYITYADLHRDVLAFAATLPPDIDCIAGIPRSGMIPATMLGLHLHLPVVDVFSLCEGVGPRAGRRLVGRPELKVKWSGGGRMHVLVLDDSIYCGSSLRAAKAAIEKRTVDPDAKFTYAAMYRHPGRKLRQSRDCDLYYRNVPAPRYFEWNLMQHPDMASFMLDIDGVVCRDPEVFDDDGPAYVESLENAVPVHVPKVPVGHLITCRIERWRPQTEAWLAKHGIKYKSLTMCPYESANARRRKCKNYGVWKGEHFAKSNCTLFIESNARQAPHIAATAKRAVICLEDGRVYQGRRT